MENSLNPTANALIEVCLEVFTEKGNSFVIADITKRVGCSKQNLYSHFRGKNGLLREALLRGIENYQKLVEPLKEVKTAKDLAAALADNKHHLRFVIQCLLLPEDQFPDVQQKLLRARVKVAKAVLNTEMINGWSPLMNVFIEHFYLVKVPTDKSANQLVRMLSRLTLD